MVLLLVDAWLCEMAELNGIRLVMTCSGRSGAAALVAHSTEVNATL